MPAAVAVLEPVLAGLAEAHRLGLVHRDVKPENVLISGAGEVKVADFGLVTASAQAGTSHVGMIMGTVAYLSPEQVETGAADARSDVYAAGVLLYELLVGEPPYTGDTAISVAYRHVNSDVPAPSVIAGDVPPELDEVVRRATRRDPAARPADAGAMLIELRRVAEQLEIPSVPVPVPPPQAAVEPPTVPSEPGRSSQPPMQHPRLPATPAAVGAGPGGTRTMIRPDPDTTASTGPPPHLQARRRSRWVFSAWTAVIVVLALLIGTVAWWLGTGRWTEMPTVVGLQETAAQQLLSQADLVATSVMADDDNAAAGEVTASDQSTGARLLRGSVVTLTVATGPPTVPTVPAGTALDAAEEIVKSAGFDPTSDRDDAEYSDSVPDGTVIRTEPGAGTELSRGSAVRLVLSKGPESDQPDQSDQVRVPMLIGKQFDEARDQLEELGLEVDRDSRFGLDRRRDRVIGQDHGAGSLVDRGTTIVLTTL